jgi:hypothetical protein
MELNNVSTNDLYDELCDRPDWLDLIPDQLLDLIPDHIIEEIADKRRLIALSNHSIEDMAEYINERSSEFEVVDYSIDDGSLIQLLQKAYIKKLAGHDIRDDLEKAMLIAANRIV